MMIMMIKVPTFDNLVHGQRVNLSLQNSHPIFINHCSHVGHNSVTEDIIDQGVVSLETRRRNMLYCKSILSICTQTTQQLNHTESNISRLQHNASIGVTTANIHENSSVFNHWHKACGHFVASQMSVAENISIFRNLFTSFVFFRQSCQ